MKKNKTRRQQKLENRIKTLRFIYSNEAIDIALSGWSRFIGPNYDKIWFKKSFTLACWCAQKGIDKQ